MKRTVDLLSFIAVSYTHLDVYKRQIWDSLNEESWKEYTETILADTREKYSTVLGDFGDEEDDDHDEIDDDEEAGAKDIVLEGTDMNSYHDFENDQGDGEDYAEYNDVDNSRYYEYEDCLLYTSRCV